MKTLLLLEPPFSTISLELEDAAAAKKYTYFSLSDVFMSETGGDSDIAKRLQEAKATGQELVPHFAYRIIMERYLQKPPKNNPNGFILDPDCFSSPEELKILLEVLAATGHPLDAVIDIRVTPEECADYMEDYLVDETEGLLEIAEYFEQTYPETMKILQEANVRIVAMSGETDARETYKQFCELLAE